MGLDLRPKCSKCSKVMELNEMRAIGNNKFQCKDCYAGMPAPSFKAGHAVTKGPSMPKVEEKFAHHQAVVDPIDTNGDHFFAPKRYVCVACGFQFKREPTKVVSKCPYCGRNAVQQKVDEPAADFIQ